MIYPFIYTRTRFHDFRVVTYNLVSRLPQDYVMQCVNIACGAIDASTQQLSKPTWILTKNNGLTLWGIACANNLLGTSCDDKESRPVRGFFGIIVEGKCDALPYGMSFFKQLYAQYVTPIWDSSLSNKEVVAPLSIPFGNEKVFGTDTGCGINLNPAVSKIFPYQNESQRFIEAVLASSGTNSIAVNIHNRRQVLLDSFVFMNILMSEDSNQHSVEFVTRKSLPEERIHHESNQTQTTPSFNPIEVAQAEDAKPQKHILNYIFYGILALICLFILLKGQFIWEKVLSPEQPHDSAPTLRHVNAPAHQHINSSTHPSVAQGDEIANPTLCDTNKTELPQMILTSKP